MTINMGAQGASIVPDVRSLDACLDACVDGDSVCFAMEYSQDFGCYIHETSCDSLYSIQDVTLYKLINCTAGE
jgi:hypothetical protein